jgi:hypothetical protein
MSDAKWHLMLFQFVDFCEQLGFVLAKCRGDLFERDSRTLGAFGPGAECSDLAASYGNSVAPVLANSVSMAFSSRSSRTAHSDCSSPRMAPHFAQTHCTG